jgi:hypothetical protein
LGNKIYYDCNKCKARRMSVMTVNTNL